MKALSIRQPWASLIASGKKTIETRTWATSYRGEFLIVASKSPRVSDLPTGHAIAIARIVDCRPMVKADERAAHCDLYPRAHAWVLEDVRKIDPFPVKGRQGLFEVEYKEVLS